MRAPEELRPSPQTEEMLRRLREEYPPLTPVDESELFVRYANNRQRLEELLVLHHVTFIVPYAKRWAAYYRDANVDDMIQCGFIGLWKAAKKFDPETYKVRFSTYAGYRASAEMQYNTRLISHKIDVGCASLNYKVGDGEDGCELIDFIHNNICDEFKYTPIGDWLEHRDMVGFARKIIETANFKSERNREIYRQYVEEGDTLENIGRKHGISREAVRLVVIDGQKAVTRKARSIDRAYFHTRTTDYDRFTGPYKKPDRNNRRKVVVEHRAPWDIESYIAYERYKLDKKYGKLKVESQVEDKWVKPEGPQLTSNGFTAKRFIVKGVAFVFSGGRWLPENTVKPPKESDYGFEADRRKVC